MVGMVRTNLAVPTFISRVRMQSIFPTMFSTLTLVDFKIKTLSQQSLNLDPGLLVDAFE